MKNILKSSVAMMAGALALVSCSDWTEPKPVDVTYDNITEADPETYARYLANLRAYRTNGHKKAYAWYANTGSFATQADHVSAVPDSLDVLVFDAPSKIHPALLNEMVVKRSETGMQMAWEVSYDNIRASWDDKNLRADLAVAEDPSQPRPFVPEWSDFLADSLKTSLSYGEAYGFDRMIVGITGKSMDLLTPEELQAYAADQAAFLTPVKNWLDAHKSVAYDFRGAPVYLSDRSILADAGTIFLQETLKASGTLELQYIISRNSVSGVPADRFAALAPLPLLDPAQASVGHWRDGFTACEIARWTRGRSEVTALGMTNLYDGYFNPAFIYPVCRQAMQILNPAAK